MARLLNLGSRLRVGKGRGAKGLGNSFSLFFTPCVAPGAQQAQRWGMCFKEKDTGQRETRNQAVSQEKSEKGDRVSTPESPRARHLPATPLFPCDCFLSLQESPSLPWTGWQVRVGTRKVEPSLTGALSTGEKRGTWKMAPGLPRLPHASYYSDLVQ
jgi:hypothetical protein